jgi:hypothetical protein
LSSCDLAFADDVVVEIGLTLGCEHTERVAQDGLARGSITQRAIDDT